MTTMTTETAIWMVDLQSKSDLDSIRSSCDVFDTSASNIWRKAEMSLLISMKFTLMLTKRIS